MNNLTMQHKDEDGEYIEPDSRAWHLLNTVTAEAVMLCSGEYVDEGAGSGASLYTFKSVKRGGITCAACLSIIKEFKSIKL